jgi:hypothetical protein
MGDPILGLACKLYRNTGTFASPTWNEITNVKDLTLSLAKGEADVTVRGGNGWRQTVGTLKEADISFSMVWDPTDEDFEAIRDAFLNNTPLELLVVDGVVPPASGDTTQGLRADMSVLSFSRNEALEEAVTVDVTAKPTYSANAPSWYDVTTA